MLVDILDVLSLNRGEQTLRFICPVNHSIHDCVFEIDTLGVVSKDPQPSKYSPLNLGISLRTGLAWSPCMKMTSIEPSDEDANRVLMAVRKLDGTVPGFLPGTTLSDFEER